MDKGVGSWVPSDLRVHPGEGKGGSRAEREAGLCCDVIWERTAFRRMPGHGESGARAGGPLCPGLRSSCSGGAWH